VAVKRMILFEFVSETSRCEGVYSHDWLGECRQSVTINCKSYGSYLNYRQRAHASASRSHLRSVAHLTARTSWKEILSIYIIYIDNYI